MVRKTGSMLPPIEIARLLIVGLLIVLLVVASVSDIRARRIPNWTVLAVAVLFLPWALFGPQVSVLSSLEAALLSLLLSGGMYAFGFLGAGDSKLLTVVALFVGLQRLIPFFLLVAIAGGALAVASLVLRPTRAMVMLQLRGKGDFGRGIPYGVAIAIGAVGIVAWPGLR